MQSFLNLLVICLLAAIPSCLSQQRPTVQLEADPFVSPGSVVKIRCNVQGVPRPVTTWKENGQPLLATDRIAFEDHGEFHLLVISNVQHTDSHRKFECHARNENGGAMAVRSFAVVSDGLAGGVAGQSPTVDLQGPTHVPAGGAATLLCIVQGQPRPAVVWTENGLPLTSSGGRIRIEDDGGINHRLIVSSAQPSDSFKKYVCRASNRHGAAMAMRSFVVQDNNYGGLAGFGF
ncbi:obscurin-like protein 1 [Culex pipiens pallens]|uniref:obscurin-like protein 1 n=1 Tax=Culex pipiens pallens TaxID=42434 RepID=UPI001952AAEB|nr:obscurin-like protein 1 [Culex pipiens pallens]